MALEVDFKLHDKPDYHRLPRRFDTLPEAWDVISKWIDLYQAEAVQGIEIRLRHVD